MRPACNGRGSGKTRVRESVPRQLAEWGSVSVGARGGTVRESVPDQPGECGEFFGGEVHRGVPGEFCLLPSHC